MKKWVWRFKRIIIILINTFIPYNRNHIIYYNQYSVNYYFKNFGNDKAGPTACGPFSCAIVASTLFQKRIEPIVIMDWTVKHGFYEYGGGTYHSMISAFCTYHGLLCEDLGTSVDSLYEKLQYGGMGIVLCKAGTFAKGNHFIAVGLGKNKEIKVYNSSNIFDCYKKFSTEQLYDSLHKCAEAGPVWYINR